MADVTYIYENLLPERTPVAVNDFIRVIGSDNASYKALVSNLAKCIVENYAGSSLAGADKSIQNAINEINTKVDLADGGFAIATSASAMTNHDLIYVYTGSETGYTYGDWYFWNGSSWTSGGEVGSIVPDASLSQEGRAADAKAVGDVLAEKADKDGVIATAEGLIGGAYTVEKEPYHFRKTAIDLAGRLDETIVGGSLGWNQLFQCVSIRWGTYSGITMTKVDDSTIHVTGTSTDNAQARVCNIPSVPSASHVFYIKSDDDRIRVRIGNASSVSEGVIKPINNMENTMIALISLGTDFGSSGIDIKPQLIDLTTLFGNSTIADYIYSLEQANAGAGVAWVKRYIDLDTYHEYDAGSIQSVEGLVSHDVVGFNQWDEETIFDDNGFVKQSDGSWYLANLSNVPLGKFFWINKSGYAGPIYFQYVYKNVNSSGSQGGRFKWVYSDGTSSVIYANPATSFTLMTSLSPVNKTVVGLVWDFGSSANSTWFKEVIVNFSDPSRNGTYEPYEKHSYPLDPTVKLNGVFKLVGDHLEADGDRWYSNKGIERRYGLVDLGTISWEYATSQITGISRFQGSLSSAKGSGANNVAGNILCPLFMTKAWDAVTSVVNDKAIAVLSLDGIIAVQNSAYTDAATFKTAMSGVYLVHELATPTTETAQPFQSPQKVDALGTEEYVTTSIVPVGHESKYYEDVAKKVNGLPKDFSTLIAPVEITFTATRNYSVGDYLIVKNQLYKVTSAISSGGTITPNSNVTATTIMAEILALA